MESFESREFPMSEEDFWTLSKLAYQHTGIVLEAHKKNLVYGRLSRRIRELNLTSFSEYISLISDSRDAEFDSFINAITTNLTSFFREKHHFDYLKSTVFPFLISQKPDRVRFWSAGCSTGEEPYSLAITIHDHFSLRDRVKILATDLDANVLTQGRNGCYDSSRVEALPRQMLEKHFVANHEAETVTVAENLRDMIVFNRLNLLGRWPMKGEFDVIFCRNVLIYFDKETQKKLVKRYVEKLKPRGFLMIGHSENISRLNDDLEFIGQTIYRKAAGTN